MVLSTFLPQLTILHAPFDKRARLTSEALLLFKARSQHIIQEDNDMYNEETNHYYVDLDGIRLVFEDGKLVGWYRP